MSINFGDQDSGISKQIVWRNHGGIKYIPGIPHNYGLIILTYTKHMMIKRGASKDQNKLWQHLLEIIVIM